MGASEDMELCTGDGVKLDNLWPDRQKQHIWGTCEWFVGNLRLEKRILLSGARSSYVGHLWLVGLAGNNESHWQVDRIEK